MKKILSLILALVMLIGLVPQMALPARAGDLEATENKMAGKSMSILGDSISTYSGVSNDASYNSTIGGNRVFFPASGQDVMLEDTWWMQTIEALDMELCVNNSWSASAVLNRPISADTGSEAYINRCVNLHNDHTNEEPDVIVVFMGTNDFTFFGKTLGTADIDYTDLLRNRINSPTTTCEAYAVMLHKMQQRYPDAEIYCMNLFLRRDPQIANHNPVDGQPNVFNAELAKVIHHFGCTVVDLESLIPTDAETFDTYFADNVHPNKLGMDLMTEKLVNTMLGEEAYVPRYSVTHDLCSGATLTEETARRLPEGERYSATVQTDAGLEYYRITVTMGGTDITEAAYSNGKICIPSVTGDIVIKAQVRNDIGNHLQTLPDILCNATNLWTELVPEHLFYTGEEWGLVPSVPNAHSITFAVNPGERIYISSLGKAGENGYGANGVRITWFNEEGVLASINSYAEDCIIIVPDGATAINVPMYTGESKWEVYLLDRKHNHISTVTAPTCTEQGYTTHTCACGDSYVADYVEAEGHDYLAEVTYPAGVVKGYTDYNCSRCSDSYRTPWLDIAAYEGKTIACVGDSITAAYGVTKDETDYVTLLAEQLGMDYIRLGDSGTTLCTDGSRTCNIRRLTEGYLQGADIVTIAMGINDFCNAAEGYYELGNINSTDTSTIYGAVRMWCERIAELRKIDSLSHTQFYFVTPVITSWNNSVTSSRDWDQSKTNIHGYTLRDLCNAIIEVASLYDVAVIDLNLLSGMYYVDAEDNNTAEFGGDGVHPGAKGHEMMANALAKALLQSNLRDDHAHTFGSWITTTWPACLAGEQQRVCTVCSAMESREVVPNSNHHYWTVVTAPTCTERGYTTYTCDLCGDSYVDSYVEATGHTEVLIPGKAATETETGLTDGKQCTVCGEITVKQEVIPMKEHTHKFSYEVVNGELMEICSCGHHAAGCVVVRNGKNVVVTLKAELYATHIYAARYHDERCMVEVKCVEVTDTVTEIGFASGEGTVKIFFLTDHYVPWLSAIPLKAE